MQINTPYKFKIVQDAANTTKSKAFNLIFPSGMNAYRLSSIRAQIDTPLEYVDGDSWTLQVSYKDLNGLALEAISEDDEIITVGEDFELLGTNGAKVKNMGETVLRGSFHPIGKYIVKDEFYLNFDSASQSAALTLKGEITGKYVKLDQSEIDKLFKTTKL